MLGLGDLFSQLWEDARTVVQAEVRLAKSRAFQLLRRSRTAILLLAVAACIVLASIVALMLGLVLALAPIVGAAWASLILLAAGLTVAALLAWLAIRLIAGPPEKPDAETTS